MKVAAMVAVVQVVKLGGEAGVGGGALLIEGWGAEGEEGGLVMGVKGERWWQMCWGEH